ncbi:MAG: S8 family serine peptidase [Candidatus Kapaibacterium sp.]
MPKLRVIAYYMHEHERLVSIQALDKPGFMKPEVTESFALGEIEETDIPKLEASGVIVRVQPALQPATAEMHENSGSISSSRKGGSLVHRAFEDALPSPEDYYNVKLAGPVLESWRTKLANAGVQLLEAIGDGGYKAKLRTDQVLVLRAMDCVTDVSWIAPKTRILSIAEKFAKGDSPSETRPASKASSDQLGRPAPKDSPMHTFDLRLNDANDSSKIVSWLNNRHVSLAGASGRKIRFHILHSSGVLDELSRMPEVDRIDEYHLPRLFNDYTRRLLNVDAPKGVGSQSYILQDGTDQIVAVADTGIDHDHPDFEGRIIGKVARGRHNDTSDPLGHGTHVAGSVLGDGSASKGEFKGMAPKAKLFFQSLLDHEGTLGGVPFDLKELFDEAYQAGARIHNNSWGSDAHSSYTITSEEVDEYVCDHKDMLVVIAAGNAGLEGSHPELGELTTRELRSICSPASSKNGLTVGACRSDRPDGPMVTKTWSSGWPEVFPSQTLPPELIAADPESLAIFTSRGPTEDRRIKPDVVAPGTDILSTRARTAPISNYWGPYPLQENPKDPHYAFDGGTSMATPMVSGCAALVRQYYVTECAHKKPSAALLKATLVNSTVWLTGADATTSPAGFPNYRQGHGRISINNAIPNPSKPGMEMHYVDDWEHYQFRKTGEQKRYQFVLPEGTPELRVCLAYTDAPARSLQNNLNLVVQHLNSKKKFLGNEELPNAVMLPDPDNNLESVRIKNPPAGTYFVQVFAANLLKPEQDFALVVTGVGVPKLVEV